MSSRAPVPVSGAYDNAYPSNSMKSKAITAQKTAPSKPVKKRRSVASVISEHSDEVKSYIIYDILGPAVKDMISAIVNSALSALKDTIETSLYGAPRKSYDRASYTDYTKRYKSQYPAVKKDRSSYEFKPRDNPTWKRPSTGNFNDVPPCRSRGDAERVLGKLVNDISKYGEVSVGDYYDQLGISSDFTDRKWGWNDLSQSGTYRAQDGYRLDLPDPEPLTSN